MVERHIFWRLRNLLMKAELKRDSICMMFFDDMIAVQIDSGFGHVGGRIPTLRSLQEVAGPGYDFFERSQTHDATSLVGRRARDGNDNIIPIAYALVEDRHESIKSAYNNLNNGWQHPPSKHAFCVRHISQNFAREFKDNALKNKVIFMGYSINKSTYRYYRREIGIVNPEALKWLDNIPRQDWIQAFDGGSRWGQMTTNLVESMNAVLKEPRNLPITTLIQSTYYKTGTLFPTMAKQHASILASGHIYTEKCMTFMKLEIRKSNSHRVDSFDRSNHTFMVHETVVPKEGRPIECSSIKYDYWSLISDVYKVETVLKVYSEAFQPIPNEGYWPQYEGVKVCHNPLMRRVKKGRPKTKRIRTEMDTTDRVPRKCGLCRISDHTKKHCPNVARTSTQN
ncbi:uncharacterized protein [Cicer arietinum]|uniref:Uncharacterized protein LOC105852403 n=1 Tax=Cicer arietinum TaxID=3827 RepID=A0A3Q7XC43_CICAR|nr:uncharacterized protein LOC105852403 [Cicer arietinum]